MRKLFLLFILLILSISSSCTDGSSGPNPSTPMVEQKNGGYFTTSLHSSETIQVFSSIPIKEGFTLEDAKNLNMFVLGDDGIISGKKYWDKFYEDSLNQKSARLILVNYYKKTLPDDAPVLFVEQLTYTPQKGYTLSTFSDRFATYQYPYLIELAGRMPSSDVVTRNYYLVHDPTLSYAALNKSVLSSNSKDQIDHYMVWFEVISKGNSKD